MRNQSTNQLFATSGKVNLLAKSNAVRGEDSEKMFVRIENFKKELHNFSIVSTYLAHLSNTCSIRHQFRWAIKCETEVHARSWLLRFSLRPARALSTPLCFEKLDNTLAAVTDGEKSKRIGSVTLECDE